MARRHGVMLFLIIILMLGNAKKKIKKYQYLQKIRFRSPKLHIKSEIHTGFERSKKSTMCITEDGEDEFQFILICPFYSNFSSTNVCLFQETEFLQIHTIVKCSQKIGYIKIGNIFL
jgi:hypothetical protein